MRLGGHLFAALGNSLNGLVWVSQCRSSILPWQLVSPWILPRQRVPPCLTMSFPPLLLDTLSSILLEKNGVYRQRFSAWWWASCQNLPQCSCLCTGIQIWLWVFPRLWDAHGLSKRHWKSVHSPYQHPLPQRALSVWNLPFSAVFRVLDMNLSTFVCWLHVGIARLKNLATSFALCSTS